MTKWLALGGGRVGGGIVYRGGGRGFAKLNLQSPRGGGGQYGGGRTQGARD